MAIAPPSDIVLDVAQAADPQRLQEAQAKLARIAAGAAATDFSAVLGTDASRPFAPPVRPTLYPNAPAVTTRPISPYQKFEAVLLQNLVDNILPRGDALFGDAASADINRSMLAEHLALQLARSNRIGIASMLEKAHAPTSAAGAALTTAHSGPASDLALQALSRSSIPRLKD